MIAANKPGWRPLLEGALAKEAKEAAVDVAVDIGRSRRHRRGTSSRSDPSLAGGAAGIAVLYAYLGEAGGGRRYESASRRVLTKAADAVGSITMAPSLHGGFAGVAWAMTHLERRFPGFRGGISTEAVDEALRGYLNRSGWRRDYDLVNGLVGLGVYALERLPGSTAMACLEGVIDRLEEAAERQAEGTTWHTGPELLPPQQSEQCPRGYYNLGLAHGVPGVIAMLGAACAAGVKRRKARRLLECAVTWLLRQKRKNQSGSLFPPWIAPGGQAESCRSAWCYGDPGVAAALFCAARSVGEAEWESEAVNIARRAAMRSPEETGVEDAGFCHGSAGLGHVFNRLYQATEDAPLRQAALFWFERTLAMRQPGSGVGGFRALSARHDGTKYWDDDPGILTGAAGIALALLAAATSVEPNWDRMFLVSAPSLETSLPRRGRPRRQRNRG